MTTHGRHALETAHAIKRLMKMMLRVEVFWSDPHAMRAHARALDSLTMAQRQYEPEPQLAWLRLAEAQIVELTNFPELEA